MARVLFVCLGNICRSPMAEAVFAHKVRQRGLPHEADSAGTAAHHEGERADPRTLDVLRRLGIPYDGRARRVEDRDFGRFDLLLAMDRANLRELQRRAPAEARGRLHLVLEPVGDDEVPDPYYGGAQGFEEVHRLLDRALDAWLALPPLR